MLDPVLDPMLILVAGPILDPVLTGSSAGPMEAVLAPVLDHCIQCWIQHCIQYGTQYCIQHWIQCWVQHWIQHWIQCWIQFWIDCSEFLAKKLESFGVVTSPHPFTIETPVFASFSVWLPWAQEH